jgi:hypothetical protein
MHELNKLPHIDIDFPNDWKDDVVEIIFREPSSVGLRPPTQAVD